jgi:hypothetical protein
MEDNKNNIKIILEADKAIDLLSGDSNGLSDPYFKIPHGQVGVIDLPKKQHKTRWISKTLNPEWKESFVIEFDPMKCSKLRIEVYDYDYIGRNDFLGGGFVTLDWIKQSEIYHEEWSNLQIEKYNKNTKQTEIIQKGSVLVKMRLLGFCNLADDELKPFEIKDAMPNEIIKSISTHINGDSLQPGNWIVVSQQDIYVGLGWDFSWGDSFDLDASVTGFDEKNKVIEFIYFGNETGLKGSVKHSGDNLTGIGIGDDEVIQISLSKVPENDI